MTKLKPKKSVVKRIKSTKRGKMLKRKAGQDHFNAHESSKKTRNKRRDIKVNKNDQKTIKKLLSN